ncbi:Non-ribosomal peptide synthase OS=Streptomyces alboniger OX=132473 GN=CP975_00270 PE=4 SV=1 [Streptomyces alboniger]
MDLRAARADAASRLGGGEMYLHDLLDSSAAQCPDASAVRDHQGVWTYAELARHSHAVSNWLIGRGVVAGDRLLVRAMSTRESAALLFGASRCGVLFVPVNTEMKWFSLRQVIEDCEPALMIADAQRDWPADVRVPVLGTPEAWREVAECSVITTPRPGATPGDAAVLMYTSGSTSAPKAVVCPHDAMLFAARAINDVLRYRPEDIVFNRFSLAWDPGLYKLLLAAMSGCELVLAGRESDLRLLQRMREVGATILPIVPSLASLITALAVRDSAPLPPIRMFTNTGATLPQGVMDELRRLFPGASVVRQFGQTECKRISIMPVDEADARLDAVGLPLPGTVIEIVDEDGRAVPPGRSGEIVVSGPHLMDGYWRAPELTARVFRRDPATARVRLHTGDYGHCDADGYLYFEGRRDDIFKRKGVRASTLEIEAAAQDIPGIRAAAALPPSGDRDLALVVEGDLTSEQLARELAIRLEYAKVPGTCVVTDRIPVNANGKYSRRAVAQLVDQAAGAGGTAP